MFDEHDVDGIVEPTVAFPTGLGARSGLPTSGSLIGRPGADWDLLAYAR
jgi:Asp-tRNA(Asn)/Glu-tRNA(Gln) amidotransferase A subunit family amidase